MCNSESMPLFRWRWLTWLPAFALLAGSVWAVEILKDRPTTLIYPPFWHTPLGVHRGTPELLALFIGARAHFSSPQSLACTHLLSATEERSAPGDDFRLTVLGANTGEGDVIYNPSLTRLEVLGDREAHPGLFTRPTGAAFAPDGTAWVSDPAQARIVRLRPQSGLLVPAGEVPPPPGGWLQPWGVAFDSAGRAYVSDPGRSLVFIYSSSGRWLQTLGPVLAGGVRLEAPRGLAVTDAGETWSFYHDDYLFVCDRDGRRLLRLDPRHPERGVQVTADLENLPAGPSPPRCAWLALDYYENLWVTDEQRCQVHKFTRHLEYLVSYGGPGSGDGLFDRPTGIALYRHFGQVFIADRQGAHYFWIGTDILDPAVGWLQRPAGLVSVRFLLTEPSLLTLTVRAPGRAPETVCTRRLYNSGPQTETWRIPEAWRDQPLEFVFTAEATYSTREHFAKRVSLRWRQE